MSKEDDNKAIIGRWFTNFWGKTCNLDIVDELAAPDMLLQYSLHAPRRGREDIKAFMTGFRDAFPDLNFWARQTSSPKGSMWSDVGKVAARIPVRLLVTSSLGLCHQQPVGRCGLPGLLCFEFKTARSQRKSVWTMA